jgi:hypothetical protein
MFRSDWGHYNNNICKGLYTRREVSKIGHVFSGSFDIFILSSSWIKMVYLFELAICGFHIELEGCFWKFDADMDQYWGTRTFRWCPSSESLS